MKCPNGCEKSSADRCINTKVSDIANTIRRQRKCATCGNVLTTYEFPESECVARREYMRGISDCLAMLQRKLDTEIVSDKNQPETKRAQQVFVPKERHIMRANVEKRVFNTSVEYVDLAKSLFGDKPEGWKIVCPLCARIYELRECGLSDSEWNKGMFGCIGRLYKHRLRLAVALVQNDRGCQFSARGLIKSPWSYKDNEGKLVHVMPLATKDKN